MKFEIEEEYNELTGEVAGYFIRKNGTCEAYRKNKEEAFAEIEKVKEQINLRRRIIHTEEIIWAHC